MKVKGLLLLLFCCILVTRVSSLCGRPGLYPGSKIHQLLDNQHHFSNGTVINYSCRDGWIPQQQESITRICLNDAWSQDKIICSIKKKYILQSLNLIFAGKNLAKSRPTLQSGNYLEKFSHLAVDGGRLIKTWKIIQMSFQIGRRVPGPQQVESRGGGRCR